MVEPRKSRILIMSSFVGFVLGLTIVLIRQYIHSGFRTSDDLEKRIGVPVIGQIPKFGLKKRSNLLPFLLDNPTSAPVEAYRNLRTSILMASPDLTPKIILSTSSVPGEGKTTNSLALAHNFSGLGRRVLLIECDIRRQTLFEYFDVERGSKGLLSAMTGGSSFSEIVFHEEKMGFDILLGENSSANAADIFSSKTFKDFLDKISANYDHIILDSPPVLVVPDARILSQYVDTVVFNVAWNRTSAAQVAESMRLLSSVNAPVAGIILGQIDSSGMQKYGYGDRYGAYSQYGKDYYRNHQI